MRKRYTFLILLPVLASLLVPASIADARPKNWRSEQVDWRLSDGLRIKAIHYPENARPMTLDHYRGPFGRPPGKAKGIAAQDTSALAGVIDTPPLDGFVPWVAVKATNDDTEGLYGFDATPRSSLTGAPLSNDYEVAIYDTGASTFVISDDGAGKLGISNPTWLSNTPVEISGVTGSVTGTLTEPLGLFVTGLANVDPNTEMLNTSQMVGLAHTVVAVGPVEATGLPTAIGSPLAALNDSVFQIDQPTSRTIDGELFSGPTVQIYPKGHPSVPNYPNLLSLELRPPNSVAVGYLFTLDGSFNIIPSTPSFLIGDSAQSLFFVSAVSLQEGEHETMNEDRFIIDTGAQVCTIGTRIATILNINVNEPEFEVEITGVNGQTEMFPGFTIDWIDMPTSGADLTFTNVPVVLIDVASPEGGTLDGIIGMNLFVEYNFVLHGGGFAGESDPALRFERIQTVALADIAPDGGDGIVDIFDLRDLVAAWLSQAGQPNWNPRADFAPLAQPDGVIDYLDFSFMENVWMQQVE